MASKKPATKKSVAQKAPAKKPVAKTASTPKPVVKKSTDKKVVAKKVIAVAKETKPAKASKIRGDKTFNINPSTLIAEFLGTFLLAALAISFANSGLEYMLIIVAVVTIFATISGSHFNPAVTFAAWINKKIDWPKACLFVVAQILGAVLAFFAVSALTTEQNTTYLEDGTSVVATLADKLVEQGITQEEIDEAGSAEAWLEEGGYDVAQLSEQLGVKSQHKLSAIKERKELFTFWLEILGAVIFGLGAGYALNIKKKSIVRGFAYAGALLAALAIVGSTAVLNPAVAFSLGAYSLSGVWPYIIYIVAPIIGVTVGFSIYEVIFKDTDRKDDKVSRDK